MTQNENSPFYGDYASEAVNVKNFVIVPQRILFLDPTIDALSISEFILRSQLILNSSGDKTSPINLYITSYGGDFLAAQGIIDYMKAQQYKVNTVGIGPIMSAAALILASGTGERSITRNSVIMVHPVSAMFNGNSFDISNDAAQIKLSQDRLFSLLEKHSKQTSSFWKKKASTNFYMSPEQALSFGLVDRIVEPNQLFK